MKYINMKLFKLLRRVSGDHKFTGHSILGSMCSEPHYIAKRTYKRFLSTNIGDPGLFPNLVEIEKEYIRELGSLLGAKDPWGMIVSGGSEANIIALWSARELANPEVREVIIPETYHFSFDKAANLLGLKLIKIPVDNNHRVKVDLVKKAINSSTMAIVGIAGTTGAGACDPIDELSDLAIEHNIYLHIDAAFGGFVYPFMENPPKFDFNQKGVSSITMDPHKMGRSVIQSGCIIYRNRELYDAVKIDVSYLSGGRATHNSILGTRSGASVAASWMVFKHLGVKGYKKNVKRCMELTNWFKERVKETNGLSTVIDPEINIVGIKTDRDINLIISKLREKGWAISQWDNFIRITLMPHVKKSYLKKFLRDLKFCISTL